MKSTRTYLLLLATTLGGCGLLGEDRPQEVRYRISSDSNTPVTVIATVDFLAQREPLYDDEGFLRGDTTLVAILGADTLVVRPPYEALVDISVAQRLLVRLIRSDSTDGLAMRAWVDGRELFDRGLPGGAPDSIVQFLYYYVGSRIDLSEPVEL